MRQMVANGHSVVMPRRDEGVHEDGKSWIKFDVQLEPPDPFADIYVLQQRKERTWVEGGIHALHKYGVATVADVDDNYLELPTWNPAFLGTHPYRKKDGVIANRAERRRLEKAIGIPIGRNQMNRDYMHATFAMVDALTVSTPYLADLYSKYNTNTILLRNYLDWDIWEDVQPQYEVERRRVFVGYLASFKYRQGDLNVIRDIIPEFLQDHPQVDFVANSFDVHNYLHVPKGRRVVVPEYAFRPQEGIYPVGVKTAVCDVGLVPLEINGLNQGKSHLKGMEYNAAGIPFIASPTESYESYWCDEGVNGFLARTPEDWHRHLHTLVTDHEQRRWMGLRARHKASKNTYQEHWPEWLRAYESVLGGPADQLTRQAIQLGAVQKQEEFAELLAFAEEREPKTVVEIGSARGGTFWAFTRIASDDALLVSIDIPAGSPLDVRGGKDVYGARNRQRLRSYARASQKVELIDADSQAARTRDTLQKILNGRQIDLLFIDGDHRYDGVKRDYTLYSPYVAPGGLIAFHDVIVQHDPRAQVDKLWNQLKKQYADWYEFISPDHGKWGGIGVLING